MLNQFENKKRKYVKTSIVEHFNVLHVAFEYQLATLGGLGVVATQMVMAQNLANCNGHEKYRPSIITPFYTNLFSEYHKTIVIAELEHLYKNKLVKSTIYLSLDNNSQHFMVAPMAENNKYFAIGSVNYIYNDNKESNFIERVLYFNSAVAAFVNQIKTDLVILHDWHVGLTSMLLREVHHNNITKSIFIVHVGNMDCGAYESKQLQGIGIEFSAGVNLLKVISLETADKIIAVSPSFLHECMHSKGATDAENEVRKAFVMTALIEDTKIISILNGFDYNNFCPIGKIITDAYNIVAGKSKLKQDLSWKLSSWFSSWKINPNLPVIFFIGRFSSEKGVDDFADLIRAIKDRATFFALGRGLTESVLKVMDEFKTTDNIFISNSASDQLKYGAMMRACAEFTFIPSRRESFCCVAPEGFANGSICITTRAGGLENTVYPLKYSSENIISGNGFVYKYTDDDKNNDSLIRTVDKALLFWSSLSLQQKNMLHLRLMDEAKSFDWLAPQGSLSKYVDVFDEMLDKSITKRARIARPII